MGLVDMEKEGGAFYYIHASGIPTEWLKYNIIHLADFIDARAKPIIPQKALHSSSRISKHSLLYQALTNRQIRHNKT